MQTDEQSILRDLDAAEPRARGSAGGFLAGRYVLVGSELLQHTVDDGDDAWVVTGDGEPVAGGRRYADRVWTRPVPRARVRCVVDYRATARHVAGGVLEVTSRVSPQVVRATWERGTNRDQARTIPEGFLWEKNDDYYYGEVPQGSLSDVRERRDRVRLGPA